MISKITPLMSAIALTMCLSACAPRLYYQVCKLEAEKLSPQSNNKPFTYENEDLAIYYNFWGESGQISMLVRNVSDRNIYVYLPECFSIINGIAYDYYIDADKSYTEGRFGSSSVSASTALNASVTWKDRFYFPYNKPYTAQIGLAEGKSVSAQTGVSSSNTVLIHATKTICIPSHSSKNIRFPYLINDNIYVDCDFDNFPKKIAKPVNFNQESSPLSIENKIAYGYTADAKDILHISNKFWLVSITNYNEKSFFYTKDYKDCLHKGVWGESTKERKEFVIEKALSTHSFYNKYSNKLQLLEEKKEALKDKTEKDW